MKIRKMDVGRIVSVMFNDVGTLDGIIIDIDDDKKGIRVFFFSTMMNQHVEIDQVKAMGKYIEPPKSWVNR